MIQIGNDLNVWLEGAADEATGSYLNAATVTFTLYATNGTTVLAGPTAMTYVPLVPPSTLDGNYKGVLESSVVDALIAANSMTVGQSYPIDKVLVSGTLDLRIRDWYILGYRTGSC